MVAPPAGGGPSMGATMTTFRVSPANGSTQPNPRGRIGGMPMAVSNGAHVNGNGIPLSARKAQPLDISTVERKNDGRPRPPDSKASRPFGLPEAPTFRPTAEEFKDPMEYIRKIQHEGEKYGIVKIIPPDSWNPPVAVDTERFHFRTRRQELNSIEGGTRANLNYLDQLAKFHKSHGNNLNRFPSVDKRPLDLFKLKKAVETRGGFDRVCKQKKWAEIGRDLGYSGKIMSSLSTSLKNSYQKWLHPYEEYLRVVKPGVHQMLEFENGGPFTPSPAPSPMKKSQQGTPTGFAADSPAMRASAALNATLQHESIPPLVPPPTAAPEPPRPPPMSSGFTAVNAGGGFTAFNAHAPPQPAPLSTPSSFSAINASNGFHRDNGESRNGTPIRNGESPMVSAKNTPDLRPSAVGSTPLSNGQAFSHLKRQLSQDTEGGANSESDAGGRRSKRLKQDAAPTVAGSHMTQPRLPTPKVFSPAHRTIRNPDERPGERCEACGLHEPRPMLQCDGCDAGYHGHCLEPPVRVIPDADWHCPKCLVGTGEFGFEEGGVYSLKQFQEKANNFRDNHFAAKTSFDPTTNTKRVISEDEVECEFWRLVESITETVEVEYGADVHSTTHGSGFPTIERNPRDPYATDPWNLNILPYHPESLFRHIKSDISGMTVPWLYVGMIFSTFCWHAEDHYTFSANFQHFGATKTWYGIPGDDALKFEAAMREAVPELFETQPDLLFQLVTLLTPEQLRKAGVKVYALDQRAGEFVITFPQAYHAGFNHGFNFNEAVNFAPPDWEPFGEVGVQRLQDFRRQPCFSHDELLLAAASRKDTTIKTAKWLAPALERMQKHELEVRDEFMNKHKAFQEHTCKIDGTGTAEAMCEIDFGLEDEDLQEDEYICGYCKTYSYLSRFICKKSSKAICLLHAGSFECCNSSEQDRFLGVHGDHRLVYRLTDDALRTTVQKVVDKAGTPEAWTAKLENLLGDGPKLQLKSLRAVLHEGEKIDWDLPGLSDLKDWVDRCTELTEEAINYTTRKQQNRRKNERAWRRGNASKAAEVDERERELRKVDNITKLLKKADDLSFDSPEITALQERFDNITEFQKRAQAALRERHQETISEKLEELLEEGKAFNVDIPELELLDKVVQQLKWLQQAHELKTKQNTLQEVTDLLQQGLELGIPELHPDIHLYQEKKVQGELWEAKAKELMSVENVHYQQLDALSKQATTLPVSPETLAKVDAILKKQRDAQEQIMSLYERSKNEDFRQRPKYNEVRDAMAQLNELNSKPSGTIDLEKEQKRHEDWMRRGKKLFGKANAPLHILHAHMKTVEEKNRACFDLSDQPRMPVEPASRQQTPEDSEDVDGSGSSRDVFCICRKPEAGMMIECELCHEWYHGKCLKIARGKVKEDDKYTCPICDYRVKIPRDATRPKLEDLQGWQDELPSLPFQPEEEETLDSIISHGQNFRDWVAKYINPIMSSPEELTTQRFYLRKLEGADILLANEINFFRQELHKWAPVAPTPPPILEVSLSTRKPRPTKQQKLMSQLGITNPEDLPQQYRTKQHNFKQRKSTDASSQPPQLQPAPEPSHTPPGLPRSMSIGMGADGPSGYFDSVNATTTYSNSPIFAPAGQTTRALSPAPFNLASSAANPPLDPAMFSASGFSRENASPGANPFASSGSQPGDGVFGDPEDMGTSHADEALAVTAAESGDHDDDGF